MIVPFCRVLIGVTVSLPLFRVYLRGCPSLVEKCHLVSSHASASWFQVLRYLPLSYLTPRHTPRSETTSFQNPVSCDPVREWDDHVFGECFRATTGFFFTVAADDNFFPDVDDLLGDITSGVTGSSASTPYVSFSLLLGIEFGVHPLCTRLQY